MLQTTKGVRELEPGVLHIGQELDTVRAPADGHVARPVSDVPQVELRLAIARLAEDAKSIDTNELQTRVARIFGWKRNGPDITAALNQAIIDAARLGQSTVDGEGMVRPPS